MTESRTCVAGSWTEGRSSRCGYVHRVYGIALHSEIPLQLPTHVHDDFARIELRIASGSFFGDAIRNVTLEPLAGTWYEIGRIPDGSTYMRWRSVGEFLVSADGSKIVCRQFETATTESFQVYLLGHALSFALVKSGFEPLHATVVVVDGQAVAFAGRSGFGKSSLAACFLQAGHRILTDDLLFLRTFGRRVLAYPGPPRIKLFPKAARTFLGDATAGVSMNPDTAKLILPLDKNRTCSTAFPLRVLYSLTPPREVLRKQGIRVEPLPPRQAFVELLKSTFNFRLSDSKRLERHLHETTRLVNLVPVRKLAFPRVWAQLTKVRDAVISDLNSNVWESPACSD